MNHHLDPEVVVSFISEAKGYLPEIMLGLEAYAANPDHSESIKEAFRYAHIIKGAASMLGLSHISELAYQLEVTLELVGDGQRSLSPDLLEYLCQVISDIADLLDLALPTSEDAAVDSTVNVASPENFASTPATDNADEVEEVANNEDFSTDSAVNEFNAHHEIESENLASQPVSADLPFPVISLTPPELPHDEFGETVIHGAPESLPQSFFENIESVETMHQAVSEEENVATEAAYNESVDADTLTSELNEETNEELSEANLEIEACTEEMHETKIVQIDNEAPLGEALTSSEFMVSLPETEETQTIGDLDLNVVADDLMNSYGAFPPPPQPEFEIPSSLISLPDAEDAVFPFDFSNNNETEILEVPEGSAENFEFDNLADSLADDLLAEPIEHSIIESQAAIEKTEFASATMPLPAFAEDSEELLPLPELPEITGKLSTDELTSEAKFASADSQHLAFSVAKSSTESNFASEVSDELLEVFMLEAEEHLQNMQTSLRGLEKTPGNRDLIQEVRRSAHSLKGTAAMIGFRNIMQLAHRMEDLLDLIFEGEIKLTPALNRLLTEATDALEDMSDGNMNQAVVSRLYEEFASVLNNPTAITTGEIETTTEPLALDETETVLPDFVMEAAAMESATYEAELELPELLLGDEVSTVVTNSDSFSANEIGDVLDTTSFVTPTEDEQNSAQAGDVLEASQPMQMIDESPVESEEAEMQPTDAVAESVTENDSALPLTTALTTRIVADSLTEFAVTNAGKEPLPAPKETSVAFVADVQQTLAPISETGEVVKSADIVQAPQPTATAQPTSQFVRVPIERLDEVVKLISEMIITRTAFEQRMGEFAHQVEELQITSSRLRRASSTLESKYEVTTLGGGRPFFSSRTGALPTVGGSAMGLSEAVTNKQTHGFDDLEFDRYTEFHLLSRELGEASSDIQTLGRELGHLNTDFLSYLNRQGRIYSELQDRLMRLRMVPLANLSPRLHRTVRTVSSQQNKQVELILEGENTAIDTTALQEIVDPLLHLLRNAVDHGIENSLERQAKGKPALGKIKLRAFYEGSQVVLQLTDDGKGLDIKKIRETAIKNGYLTAPEVESMSSHELWSLIFTPGFSTADHVSEISGRGVGMDIVHTTIQKLKGTISVDSQFGHGTTFTIRLPLTLAVTRALMVKANSQNFAIPLDVVTQIMRVETDKIERIGKEPVIRVAGKVYPLLMLSRLLNMKSTADDIGKRPPALMLNIEGKEVVVIVDQLLGGREIVIKTLGTHLRKVHGVMGATLMGDGEVVLILNLAELLRGTVRHIARRIPTIKVGAATEQTTKGLPASEEPVANDTTAKPRAEKQVMTVLVVDDSPSVRRVSSNLIKSVGWIPVQAKDGLDALDQLQSGETLPDLIMLDIEMPRMDGYQLLASLRALPVFRNLPIVIVSSRSSDKHRQKAFDLGATEYLVKPYQDDQVIALIRRLVKESLQ